MKKTITALLIACCIFSGCSKTPQSTSASNANSSTMLSLSDKAKLAEERIVNGESVNENDVKDLEATELRILRNAVFARHGRKYDSEGLGAYFNNRSWYKPRDDYSDNALTPLDRANVKLILAVEQRAPANASNNTAVVSGTDAVTQAVTSPPPPTQDQPSEVHARRVLENLTRTITIMFRPPLSFTVRSFRKTDGQSRVENGVKQYKVYFEAEVECSANEYVGDPDLYHLGIGGSHKKGLERITGSMIFEKTERGWKGEDRNVY